MAITRTQIAKQLLAQGGRIGLKGGADAATASFGKSAGYKGPSRKDPKGGFDLSGGKGPTFGGAPPTVTTKDQAKDARDRYEKQFFNKGQVPPLGSRPTDLKTKLNQSNLQKRLNFINYLQNQFNKKLQKGLMDPSIPGVDVMTEEELLDLAPSVEDLVKKGFYSKDGKFATGEKIPDFGSTQMAGSLGIVQDIFEGPVTSDKLKELSEQLKTLEGLKTTEGLEETSVKDLMEIYQPDRFKRENEGPVDRGSSDPCKGPNPPAYCFVGIRSAAPKIEELEYINPLSKLTPRIAGSQFAAEGGLMGDDIVSLEDMDREAFLLGGIAKGLKKAVRGVKKIAKSPLGKAALIGAGFGLAGMGPFKGLANTSFGQGLAGLKGTLLGQAGSRVGETFVPFKEGLLTKLGLTKGGGSLMPTVFGGITLASILPLLAGKTDEEKDDILKEYYASQKLIPSTTKRQMGSEFDFYNYNLAKGGMPSKEPVAKKVMPLLDMDGMEKDYRADGGFVPIGRMEKADDVPARLSKNEFVFTADAVRNAGEGDVDKGAEVMYNMMKNLESGGEVSEESQGLDGAREMFQTSQRLGEVI
jgi:hypothetical protein